MDGRKTSLSPVFFYKHLKLGFYQVLKKKLANWVIKLQRKIHATFSSKILYNTWDLMRNQVKLKHNIASDATFSMWSFLLQLGKLGPMLFETYVNIYRLHSGLVLWCITCTINFECYIFVCMEHSRHLLTAKCNAGHGNHELCL